MAERINARLKDEFGARLVRVRGAINVGRAHGRSNSPGDPLQAAADLSHAIPPTEIAEIHRAL